MKKHFVRFLSAGTFIAEETVKPIESWDLSQAAETLEQVKAKGNPNDRILISNMEINGWGKVVTTCAPYKWTQPFNDGDSIVSL